MPIYEYECARHGYFEVARSLDESAMPHECPECGNLAARVILSSAALATMSSQTRRAHVLNERSAHEPKTSATHRHSKNCGCGSKAKKATDANAARGFPSRRPWMISH
jgi:putative FmdB family regulatory protein